MSTFSRQAGARWAPAAGGRVPVCRRPVGALAIILAVAPAVAASRVEAQECEAPAASNEAKLLAFYEAPMAYSLDAAPRVAAPGSIRISMEVEPMPTPSESIQNTGYCFQSKTENTRLSSVFARPRVTIGLPGGFQLDGSYVPPIRFQDAEPHLGSLALSHAQRLSLGPNAGALTLMFRAHGTVGRVRGPITCPRVGLQTTDPTAPCYGTSPSRDTFHPYMVGAEGVLGLTPRGGRWSVYAGGGVTLLRPRFQVGFTDGSGIVDTTRVFVNLTRGSVFGGLTAYLTSRFEVSAQVYSVPTDVTTVRFAAGYVLR